MTTSRPCASLARRAILPLLASILIASCAAPGGVDASTPPDPAKDPRAEVLREADRAFAADVADRGLEGWLAWFTPDAVKLDIDTEPVRGHAAIAESDGPLFADPELLLSWTPDASGWLEPGRRGFTRGTWTYRRRDAGDEQQPQASGHYLTLWILTDSGWLCEFDFGVADE
jgi:ketosteroid isomerase-like protein